MDKFGVPKKVNRHVIKAIYELNSQEFEDPKLSNICDFVKLAMKNNVPVANLQSVVRQSLRNLNKLGVIQKQGANYYTTRSYKKVESFPENPSKHINTRIFRKSVRKERGSSLDPNNRKRGFVSDDSILENDPESSIKRLRTNKILSRKGQNVLLPKVRIHNNYQLLSHNDEMEQGWYSNSSLVNSSEDESEHATNFSGTELKPQLGSDTFEPPSVVDKKESNKISQSSDNLEQPIFNSSHRMTDSQIQNYHLRSVHVQINKLDVLNDTNDERIERKICSENDKTTSEEQKEPTVSKTEEALTINVMRSQENINNASTDQTSRIVIFKDSQSGHQISNSQIQSYELNKCNDVLILNEKKLKLDESNKCSESDQTTNNKEQKEPIVSDTDKAKTVNVIMTNHENNSDDQTIEDAEAHPQRTNQNLIES